MPDLFTVAPDGYGTPTIWDNTDPDYPKPVAWQYGHVMTGVDVASRYGPLVWQVLTSVLTADEATVERVARRYEAGHQIRVDSGSRLSTCECGDDLEDVWTHDVRAVLAALRVPAGPEGGAA